MVWSEINYMITPYNDAYNYREKDKKEFFSKVFVKTKVLNDLKDNSIYYLIGEKGTGKTAYAVWNENNPSRDTVSKLTVMTETQYKRFISLKKDNKLQYSDYANIWRSILLFLSSQMIIESSGNNIIHRVSGKFKKLQKELEAWTKNSLNPEMETAFDAINKMAFSAGLGKKDIASISATENGEFHDTTKIIKHHLLERENGFKEALSDIKLPKNHVIFIDGIDFRPENIPHNEYIECIKGLGEACWQLNSDFFSRIKDSKGRIRIVLILRPDIFHSMNIYNSNSRIRDNSVFISFSKVDDFSSGDIFKVCDKYFESQQKDKKKYKESMFHYFLSRENNECLFNNLKKITYNRPRDFLTYIKMEIEKVKNGEKIFDQFTELDVNFISDDFSDYIVGEMRNYASFYIEQKDFDKYIKFFDILNGRNTFTYQNYIGYYNKFKEASKKFDDFDNKYLNSPIDLLQFFYDVGLIGYRERLSDGTGYHYYWSFRERTPNKLNPQVKPTDHLMVNMGASKSLNVGKSFSS